MDQHAGLHDFDFFHGSWITQNKRRTNALYHNQEGVWQEFPSILICTPYLAQAFPIGFWLVLAPVFILLVLCFLFLPPISSFPAHFHPLAKN